MKIAKYCDKVLCKTILWITLFFGFYVIDTLSAILTGKQVFILIKTNTESKFLEREDSTLLSLYLSQSLYLLPSVAVLSFSILILTLLGFRHNHRDGGGRKCSHGRKILPLPPKPFRSSINSVQNGREKKKKKMKTFFLALHRMSSNWLIFKKLKLTGILWVGFDSKMSLSIPGAAIMWRWAEGAKMHKQRRQGILKDPRLWEKGIERILTFSIYLLR